MFTRSSTGSSATDYLVAGSATIAWLAVSRYVPVFDVMPGAAMLLAMATAALLYRSGPVVLTVLVSSIGVEMIRPAPTLQVHAWRAVVLAIFGLAIAAIGNTRMVKLDAARQYEMLFDENPLPMWVFETAGGAFLGVNRAAIRTYGYSRDEFLRMTLKDVCAPAETEPAFDKRSTAGHPNRPGVWRHRTKDGLFLQVFVRSQDVTLDGRRARLALLEDVTERTTLEQQLRQAQKMEAIGQLAGGIAHDFNNLLAVIQGFSSLAIEGLPPDDTRRRDLQEVIDAGHRASDLTRQLLAFSRKQLLQMRVLVISDIVREMTPMLRRLIGETVTIDIRTDAVGRSKADQGQLQQIVLNLVVNARDAMHGAGRITIETADVDLDAEYCRQHASVSPGPHVMLAVSDTGAGMDAATQARIFEPFFTTKTQGTGLGLATVYGIVKQSGGHIWIYSEVGRGTIFKVYFPRTLEGEPAPAVRPKRPRSGDARVVLLVEDETGVRTVATRILQNHDYVVHAMESPRKAIEMVSTGLLQPDVLLTDMVLPEMNGQALAEAVQEKCPDCKVVFMSGYTDTALFENGTMSGDAAFLSKPFTAASLTDTLAEALERV